MQPLNNNNAHKHKISFKSIKDAYMILKYKESALKETVSKMKSTGINPIEMDNLGLVYRHIFLN